MSKRDEAMRRLAAGESPQHVARALKVNETWVASLARDVRAAKKTSRANRWFAGEFDVDMEGCEELFDALPRPVQAWLLNMLPKGRKMAGLLSDFVMAAHADAHEEMAE